MSTHSLRSFLRIFAFSFITILLFSSCEKEPGDGGLATIKGKVLSYRFDNDGVLVDSGYVGDVRVFISYGDNTWVDDDARTSYTGEYAFEWLQKGAYKIWVISDCPSCPENQQQDVLDVTVDERKETIDARDLKFYKD
ncbi:MAG: hypothetical protein SH857_00205 [Chitinophagales bacterium]|nr:hypothetical protein [Chitinophagales bacterium]